MGVWPEVQELTASNAMPGDEFGIEVSLDGNQLIVGAAGVDRAAGSFTGAAYLYENIVPFVRPVPTLNQWSVIIMTLLLGFLAINTIRKRRSIN